MVAGGIGSKQGGSDARTQAGAKVQHQQGMQRATGKRVETKIKQLQEEEGAGLLDVLASVTTMGR